MATLTGGSIQRAILDEIALEGLEGITLRTLWIYLAKTLNISGSITEDLKQNIWKFILSTKDHLEFYKLPEEREPVKLFDRYQCVDSLGIPLTPNECPYVRYKYVPISNDNVVGSCRWYEERVRISHNKIKELNVNSVLEKYGNQFVIVASQELRYRALTPENVPRPRELNVLQYCLWEAIGRSRHNGETTSGLYSLSYFCKDQTDIFYMKNKLLRSGVVVSRIFHERRNDRLIATTLLTLPRFRPSYRSAILSLVEKLFSVLKEKPDFAMPVLDARQQFETFEKRKTFQNAMESSVFLKVFETQQVPYYDVYPDIRAKASSSRTVKVIKLRYPDKSIENIIDNIENGPDKNEENITEDDDFFSETHSYVDMPMREEFYRCVSRFGSRGCSQSEIGSHMCISHLSLRQLLKKSVAEGLVKTYFTDIGRQRTTMYVAAGCFDAANKSVKDSLNALKKLQCSEYPTIPKFDMQLQDIPQISVRIKNYEFPAFSISQRNELKSQRIILRQAFVIKLIDDKCIMSASILRKLLIKHEKSKGIKDEICQKSVKRLLYQMSHSKTICVYEIMLQRDETIARYQYVTHPKIDVNHFVLKNEILKLKNNLYLAVEEKRLRLINSLRNAKRIAKSSRKARLAEAKQNKMTILPITTNHKPPKFLISRYMHEFLFYIVVELNEFQTPLSVTRELLQTWQLTEPSLRIEEYLEQMETEFQNIKAYTSHISWRTFISPLPRYSDKPAGWVYFTDAMDRMPLSIFNKIFRIDNGADEKLTAFLNHPVRQHYIMRQLPSDLQCKISRVQLQRVYISLLKLLNHMGLIQVTERLNVKDPLFMWVYLNRRARVLDTTNSEAGYMCINSEREYSPIVFDLRSFDDVHCYWTSLQRICVYTKLGFRIRNQYKEAQQKKSRGELSFLNAVDFDEAPQHDIGYQPGDGLGAAGLSTNLFAHTFRNWSWSVHSNSKLKNNRTGRSTGSGLRSTNKTMRVIARKSRPSHTVAKIKRISVQPAATSSERCRKSGPRDAIDRDALKNMRTLRVKWSKVEDEMLLIAKAVYTYIGAPVSALGLITVCMTCRDVIRHSLGVYNKTTAACVRRLNFICQQGKHIPHVPTWLHMLQTDEYLQKKYGESFLPKLKRIYPSKQEYYEALSLHFTHIMCYLLKLVHKDYDYTTKSRFILPDSIQEFHKRFLERMPISTDEDTILYKNPKTVFDLQTVVAESAFHSSLCSMRDKTLYNLQAFEIYKSYPDEVLEAAFTKARTDGLAVRKKRRNISLLPSNLSGPPYELSSKYQQKLQFLRIPYGIYDVFHKFFTNVLITSLHNSNGNIIELKSPTPGQFFVIAEGHSRNMWQIGIKLPINILTVDAEQNQANISSMDRILGHYHSFDHAPQQEYTKVIESGQNEKQSRVKFHPANLCYKINYNPYDFIAKLPIRYLHFFCALDYWEKEIEINFSKLQHEDEDGHMVIDCPFKCIFTTGDYINEIKRIVEEKKVILNSLTEMAPQKLLNQATSGLSMKVYNSNILTLVRMLESYWHEKETKFERKDLGKYPSNLKSSKSIDWCQLCNDILAFNARSDDFDKAEEYEPTLNKEEKVIRAQDVFVVNLPTIQVKINDELKNDKDTTCLREDLYVPKKILEPELKDFVLKKVMDDSLWKYNENSLESLKDKMDYLGFSELEQKHLKEILDFIEKYELGVTVNILMTEFPCENFLLKALKFFSSEYFVKRVGISSFMYVHKNHIRSWVVHTFNLKRLDRENIGGSTNAIKKNLSKEGDGTTCEENNEEPPAKKAKNTSSETEEEGGEKRTPKPIKRFDSTQQENTKASDVFIKDRTVIAMKPVPWIRLNGSLNRRVLDRYMGSILAESIARNGCSVYDICKKFSLFVPVDIFFLLELLSDLKCISLVYIPATKADLFSDFEISSEKIVSFVYDSHNTFIKVYGDATMRFSLFVGDKKYSTELV